MLKPGAKFCSYEWVSTKMYDPNIPQHVKVIDEINYGNGLPVIFCPSPNTTTCTLLYDAAKHFGVRTLKTGLAPQVILLA